MEIHMNVWMSGGCHHPKIHYEWAMSGAQGHQYPNAVPRRWITESSRIKLYSVSTALPGYTTNNYLKEYNK